MELFLVFFFFCFILNFESGRYESLNLSIRLAVWKRYQLRKYKARRKQSVTKMNVGACMIELEECLCILYNIHVYTEMKMLYLVTKQRDERNSEPIT